LAIASYKNIQFEKTGTKALTHDKAWILLLKTESFVPGGEIRNSQGINAQRYLSLQKVLPDTVDMPPSMLYTTINSVNTSLRRHYREEYGYLLTADYPSIEYTLNTANFYSGRPNIHKIAYYIGLAENDALGKKVFLEAVVKYPWNYLANVMKGFVQSLRVQKEKPPFLSVLVDGPEKVELAGIRLFSRQFYHHTEKNRNVNYGELIRLWEPGIVLFSVLAKFRLNILFAWVVIAVGSISVLYESFQIRFTFKNCIFLILLAIVLLYILQINMIFRFRPKDLRSIEPLVYILFSFSVLEIFETRIQLIFRKLLRREANVKSGAIAF
jgi:hypothetical protein